MKPKKKAKFRVGQVVYMTRHMRWGKLTKRHKRSFEDGWYFTITYTHGIATRQKSVVVESELRPLTAKEQGPRKGEKG